MSKTANLRLVDATVPTPIIGTVPPRRRRNAEVRAREHLLPDEVEKLLKVAGKRSRYGHRDRTMILLAYRHGLRVSELVGLRWRDVDIDHARMFVRRLKGSDDGMHPLAGDEQRMLRQLRRDWPSQDHLFLSERGAPVTAAMFRKMLARTSIEAGLGNLGHPHALRHGCGFALIDRGIDVRTVQAWLGHRVIAHTVKYTAVSARRFEIVAGIWG